MGEKQHPLSGSYLLVRARMFSLGTATTVPCLRSLRRSLQSSKDKPPTALIVLPNELFVVSFKCEPTVAFFPEYTYTALNCFEKPTSRVCGKIVAISLVLKENHTSGPIFSGGNPIVRSYQSGLRDSLCWSGRTTGTTN